MQSSLYNCIYSIRKIKIVMSQYPIHAPFSTVQANNFQNKNLVHSSYIPSNSYNSSQQGSFLNRNTREHNISSNSIDKNKYIQAHMPKLRRQNSLNTALQLKQNDPYFRNCNNLNFLNIANNIKKPQFQSFNEQFNNNQHSYFNPLISKRQKKVKLVQNLQHISQYCNRSQSPQMIQNVCKQTLPVESNINEQILNNLNLRISDLQKKVDNNKLLIDENSKKINQNSKSSSPQKQNKSQKHLRSFSTATSSSKNYKQLTQIMTLIQETKDYQRKNSQQYRKMIEQFRNTILEFRDQLNKTVKRKDYQTQTSKIKQSIQQLKCKNFSKEIINVNGAQINASLNQTNDRLKEQKNQLQQQLAENLRQLHKQINKLQENNISLKADIVKITLRQKMNGEDLQTKIFNVQKQIRHISDTINKRLQQQCYIFKIGKKCEGQVLSFSVQQILLNDQTEKRNNSTNSTFSVEPLRNNQNIINSIQKQKINCHNNLNDVKFQVSLAKKTYYIDIQGYLLDSNSHYLLNDKEEAIKLSNKQLNILKKYGILIE